MNCDFGKCFHNLYKLASQEKFRTESLFRVNMIYLGLEDPFQFVCQSKHSGGHSALTHTGGSIQEIFMQPKKITSASLQPKNISSFYIYINLYMNIKYPQTMQIEVRIASIEPRNINITMFGINKYHEHSFRFLWTQKYHFWQHSDSKISDLPLRMCMCRVPSWEPTMKIS